MDLYKGKNPYSIIIPQEEELPSEHEQSEKGKEISSSDVFGPLRKKTKD